jgi:hypothetical protein
MNLVFGLFFAGIVSVYAESNTSSNQSVKIAITSQASEAELSELMSLGFNEPIKACKNCEVVNFSPYKNGQFDESKIGEALIKVQQFKPTILILNWNRKYSTEWDKPVQVLLEMADALIVASPGSPNSINSAPFSSSLLKKIPQVLIIGDYNNRDIPNSQNFFGPEIIAFFRGKGPIPQDGLAALQLGAQLGVNWSKKTKPEWIEQFSNIKASSRKLTPDLRDFFKNPGPPRKK